MLDADVPTPEELTHHLASCAPRGSHIDVPSGINGAAAAADVSWTGLHLLTQDTDTQDELGPRWAFAGTQHKNGKSMIGVVWSSVSGVGLQANNSTSRIMAGPRRKTCLSPLTNQTHGRQHVFRQLDPREWEGATGWTGATME